MEIDVKGINFDITFYYTIFLKKCQVDKMAKIWYNNWLILCKMKEVEDVYQMDQEINSTGVVMYERSC